MQLVICLHDAVGLTLIYNEDSFGHPTPQTAGRTRARLRTPHGRQ